MTINEQLKKAVDDLDLDRRLDQVGKFAQKTYEDVRAQVGHLAHDNRDKVDGWVAKAADALDQRTEGKYHDKVTKLGVAVGNAVDKVAEQRPETGGAPGASGPVTGEFEEFSGPRQQAPTEAATPFPVQYPSDRPHGDQGPGHQGFGEQGSGHPGLGEQVDSTATNAEPGDDATGWPRQG